MIGTDFLGAAGQRGMSRFYKKKKDHFFHARVFEIFGKCKNRFFKPKIYPVDWLEVTQSRKCSSLIGSEAPRLKPNVQLAEAF